MPTFELIFLFRYVYLQMCMEIENKTFLFLQYNNIHKDSKDLTTK